MTRAIVRLSGSNVVLVHDNVGIGFSWDSALALAAAMKRLALRCARYDLADDCDCAAPTRESVLKNIAVIGTGLQIILERDNRAWLTMPYRAAQELATAVTRKAKELEEKARAEQLIADQSLLLKTGAPFSLTNDRQLLAAAASQLPGAGNVVGDTVVSVPRVLLKGVQ